VHFGGGAMKEGLCLFGSISNINSVQFNYNFEKSHAAPFTAKILLKQIEQVVNGTDISINQQKKIYNSVLERESIKMHL